MNSFYVTTPIYYVNDKPHIGHAYTTVLADVFARANRLAGRPTWFLTGTDEHGQKVQEAATARGVPAQQHVDETVLRFQELWKRLNITNDDFIRTTEPRHTRVVQAILQDLYDRGEIYRAEYDGLYDVRSETFITEKDLPEGKRPEDLPHIKRIRETNYFFRMSKYQDWLVKHIQDNPSFILPEVRRNETLGFLRQPLQDLCISRPKARLTWGIELPFDKDYVTYVWFDALVNYISGVGYRSDDAMFAKWWPATIQLIGKDILTTHTVYWTTMLKAMGVEQPRTVFAHGWWLSGKDKMSKSLGNVVNPMDILDRHGVDAFRYYLMAEMALGSDASFTPESFVKRYNSDLANDLGNLFSRVLKLVETGCGGVIPAAPAPADGPEQAIWAAAVRASDAFATNMDGLRPDLAIGEVLRSIRDINVYFDGRAPWKLAKAGDTATLGVVLRTALECLRVCASLLAPVIPGKVADLRGALGLSPEPSTDELRRWGVLVEGTRVQPPASLFPRILPPEPEKPAMTEPQPAVPATPAPAPAPAPAAAAIPGVEVITYADFAKVQLRTARIEAAETVQGADKLLKLQLDVGGEKRQIIAGIALFYTPEELPGKVIVIVANLAPAKIRGVESNGMLLAASIDGKLRLVTTDGELPSTGASVK